RGAPEAKGIEWALYRGLSGGQRRAVGDACRQRWTAAKAVGGQSADAAEVINLYKAGELEPVESVDQAIKTAQTGEQSFAPSAVTDTTEVAFDFTREIVVKTESELKKDLNRSRLLKRQTKALCGMSAPNDTGTGTEHVYFFKSDEGSDDTAGGGSSGARRVAMRVTRKLTFDTKLLESHKQAFQQQGQRVFQEGLDSIFDGDVSCLGAKLSNKAGAAALQTYADFLRSEVGAKDDDDGDSEKPPAECIDADGVLEGVAASAMPPPTSLPRKGSRNAGFVTPSRSAVAIGVPGSGSSTSPLDDGASCSGSMLSVDEEDQEMLHADDLLRHWKAKIDLKSVMSNEVDGRIVAGLRKRIRRLRAKPETYSDADTLAVFEAQVALCEKFRAECMGDLSWSDAQDIVMKLSKAGVCDYPRQTRLKLVSLKLASLNITEDAEDYVRIASPMNSGVFDPADPTLGGAEANDKERVAEFIRVVVKGHLNGMIYMGPSAQSTLVDVLAACSTAFGDADYLTCTAAQIRCASDVNDVCAVLLHCIWPAPGATVLDIADQLERVVGMMDKTGASAGCVLAAAVASTPFYKEKVDAMFRALPFAREQLPSIRKATEALADGGQDRSVRSNRSSVGLVGRPEPSMEQLKSRCQSLLAWCDGLPTHAAELSGLLKQKVIDVVTAFNSLDYNENPIPSREAVASISELVQEASISFTSDAEVEQLQHTMASVLQTIDSTNRCRRFFVASESLMPEWSTGAKWSTGRACLEALLVVCPEKTVAKRLGIVSDVCAFLAARDAVAAVSQDADVVDSEGGIQLLDALAAKLPRAKEISEGSDAEFLDLNLRNKNDESVAGAVNLRSAAAERHVAMARDRLKGAIEELDKMKYATASGKEWWEGLMPAASLHEVSKHMQAATAGTQWTPLKDKHAEMTVLLSDYVQACKWGGLQVDADMKNDAGAVSERVAITLAEVVILMKLTTERNSDLLRQAIVDEVKVLRMKLRSGVKEDRALHIGVFQPMMAFLLGR
ncbi:unnamed protein product, partial [Prorocentrum cordatum]